MGEYFVGLAGTSQGEQLALFLALISAFAHAVFAALNKQGLDPYLNRGAINVAYSILAAPFALFVFPLPEGFLIPVLFASFITHILYEWMQSAAFVRGAFTLVYPIARGTGPLLTALIAIPMFSETLGPGQWIGLVLLSGAIISLAGINLCEETPASGVQAVLLPTITLALGTGLMVTLYTLVDAYGIRITADPFTFLAWFFFMGGFGFPVVAYSRWRKLPEKPPLHPLIVRGLTGAIIAFISFATLMLATRIGKVSEAAALRETSIIFATGIGVLFFKEKLSTLKLLAIGLITIGAIMVEYA